MTPLPPCHTDLADCICCGQSEPDEMVISLVTAIASEAIEDYAQQLNQIQVDLKTLFDTVGTKECAHCSITRLVTGALHASECCERAPRTPIRGTVSLESDLGKELLREAAYQRDLLPLLQQFELQQQGWWCAVATATMVLNALPIERPASKYAHYRLFTQERFFDSPKAKELGLTPDNKSGISLGQLEVVLDDKPDVWADATQLRSLTDEQRCAFRELLQATLTDEQSYLMVNYSRGVAQQGHGAHFSPIAAYHADADAVLILDTAKFKYAPFWMSVELLLQAMNTQDSKNPDAYRGYMRVGAERSPPA